MKHTGCPKYRPLRAGIAMAMLLIVMSVFGISVSAQTPIKYWIAEKEEPDSVDAAEGSKRHFWRASAEVVGFNTGLWAYDRFIEKGDFAYISLNTIKENFKHGFMWDNDKLGTNTFLHPYNGSLYYNAGRSNGFNYWQSAMFAIGGSAMWELFMEREYPSTNDFIATPIGGSCIGEILYRASDAVIDERTSGVERAGREITGFIISPMRGFNRLITGKMWRHSATSGRVLGTPNVAIQLSTGVKLMSEKDFMNHVQPGNSTQLDIEYGDRFEIRSHKPFDFFTVRAELQFIKRQPVLSHIAIKGRLLAREYLEDVDTHVSVGLFQHFDYFDSDSINGTVPFKLGIPASVGAGIYFRDIERRKWILDAYLHTNGVILGSILSDHYMADERNYNWASGFSLKAGINLIFAKRKFSISLTDEYYRLFSWVGYRYGTDLSTVNPRTLNVQGDHSCATFNVTDFTASMQLHGHFYLGLNLTAYYRSSRYRDFPHVRFTSTNLRLMLTYKL